MRDQRNALSIFGALVCLAFMVHILLASLVIIMPEASRINPVLKFYRRFVVLGPFFPESRIRSKSHLMISQYKDGAWSNPADYACDDIADGIGNRYLALQRRSFEVFLTARAARATRDKDRARTLSELEMYVRSQERFSEADSIAIMGVRRGSANEDQAIEIQHKFKR
jgi:hypothetical protein